MALPVAQYKSAIHTIKPGILNSEPATLTVKPPERPHKIPTKLASVTTEFSKPMDKLIERAVNWLMSSAMR